MKDSFGNVLITTEDFIKGVKKQVRKKIPEDRYIQMGISNKVLICTKDENGMLDKFYYLSIVEDKDGNSKIKMTEHSY